MLLLFIEQLSLLPFPFDLRHHGTFTDEQQLRTVHGIFMDLRIYDNYGHFTEYSRNFHGLTDEQQLRIFMELSRNYGRTAITDFSQNFYGCTNVTELFENNHGNWS